MNKNSFAVTPPMGWNSWDCYGAAVTEAELIANAEYMAEYLKPHGWEYVVCDIQWYEPDAVNSHYRPFVPLDMDEYSRLIPAVKRFPSSVGGNGFKPIADHIHKLGLKFGIHIMRGIPRQAVHSACKIKGSTATARDIAHTSSICNWNTDMYGVSTTAYGAQQYYDSLFELYAEWGVDYVKVDDICITYAHSDNLYSGKGEIELIRNAIDKCGRDIVLSLSPGAAIREQAEHLCANANMWRISSDFWDRWDDVMNMFNLCRRWEGVSREGCWPDCDILPLGHLGLRSVEHGYGDRYTKLTHDEQLSMVTLWCIFRSPLMLGAELRDNDRFTLELITNDEVLALLKTSYGAREVAKGNTGIIWTANDTDGSTYVALFNPETIDYHIECTLNALGLHGTFTVRDLWKRTDIAETSTSVHAVIPSHGVSLFKLSPKYNND